MAAVVTAIAPYGYPCLIVDDGSQPDTARQLAQLAQQFEWVNLLRLPRNQGKGGAVMAGLKQAYQEGYSHALQVDADGQHNLADIPALIALSQANPHSLVSGQPCYDRSVPKSRLYGRYITHFWVAIETLSCALKDSMCGFRIYPLAESITLLSQTKIGQRMDFDTEIMVKLYWAGVDSLFIPTKVIYPANGLSHFKVFKDNMRISWMHTRLFFAMLPRVMQLIQRRRSRG